MIKTLLKVSIIFMLIFLLFEISEETRLNTAINTAYVKNAPALEEKNPIWKFIIWILKSVPYPKNSLTAPIRVSARVKPIPINNPSRIDQPTLFLLAKLSALPRIMQLTTISGR